MTVILRTSERRAFKRCPAKWWWAYREGLVPKGAESTALWFGTGVHLGLAEWYLPGTKRGPHPAETFAAFAGDAVTAIKVADADEQRVAEYVDGKELGIKMLEGYVERYGTDPQWDFISAEQTFSLNVPWPRDDRQALWIVDPESGDILVEYDGTFDGVYRDLETGRLELLETKTCKGIQTSHLSMDDQAGSYWAVANHTLRSQGLISRSETLAGINYNFLRKALPDDRPVDDEGYATNKPLKAHYIHALQGIDGWTAKELGKLKLDELEGIAVANHRLVLGDRSKVQPTALFHREMVFRTSQEQRSQLRRIQDEALHMRALREKLLPIVKNPTRDCTWDCAFFQMCELQERGGNWQDHRSVAFSVKDPYADHRKSSDE